MKFLKYGYNTNGFNIRCINMGFDVNFTNKPVIQGAQSSQDGGAGNLGYFEQEKDEKAKKDANSSIFSKAQEADSFKKSDASDFDENFSISKLIAEIIFNIKEWFKKLFRIK